MRCARLRRIMMAAGARPLDHLRRFPADMLMQRGVEKVWPSLTYKIL